MKFEVFVNELGYEAKPNIQWTIDDKSSVGETFEFTPTRNGMHTINLKIGITSEEIDFNVGLIHIEPNIKISRKEVKVLNSDDYESIKFYTLDNIYESDKIEKNNHELIILEVVDKDGNTHLEEIETTRSLDLDVQALFAMGLLLVSLMISKFYLAKIKDD